MHTDAMSLLNEWGAISGGAVARACLGGAAFFLGVWLVCCAARRLPGAVRAGLWWLVCLKMLVSLFGGLVAVPLPVLPPAHTVATVVTPKNILSPPPIAHIVNAPGDVSSPAALSATYTAPLSRVPAQRRLSLSALLLTAWLVGICVCLARAAAHYAVLRRLLRQATPPDNDDYQAEMGRIAWAMGMRRAPRLLVSAAVTTPLVTGLFPPTLVLPARMETLSPDETRLALAHEMAHLRRGDLWLGLIPALAQIVWFWFPPLWIAVREYAAAREEACDADALRVTCAPPARLGHLLLKLVTGDRLSPALGLSPRAAHLQRRLTAMTTPRWDLLTPHARGLIGSLLVGALLLAVPWRLTTFARAASHADRPGGAAPRYRITDLGTLGGRETSATDISNTGQVVGYSAERAVRWANGKILPLGALHRFHYSLANAVNDRGQVAAAVYNDGAYPHALLWQDARRTLGALPGYRCSEALGINNGGQVVGDVQRGGYGEGVLAARAFLWSAGRIRDLGTLGGDHSCALSINDLGQIVGKADLSQHVTHAFFWQDGRMQDLGTLPGGTNSLAYKVNAAGQVAGYSETFDSRHAFLWQDGQMQDLGTLPGDTSSEAHGLNSGGAIVGMSNGGSSPARAVLWNSSQTLDLNALVPLRSGWTLEDAQAINDAGQIVGHGQVNGQEHAFLLTPA